jgi:hypothetical protein
MAMREKLRGCGIGVRRAGHGDSAAIVGQAVIGFVFDGVMHGFLVEACVEAAALRHEAGNDAMENSTVIKTFVNIRQKICR